MSRKVPSSTRLSGAEVETDDANDDDGKKKESHRCELLMKENRANAGDNGNTYRRPDGVGNTDFDGFDGECQAGNTQAVKNDDPNGRPQPCKAV